MNTSLPHTMEKTMFKKFYWNKTTPQEYTNDYGSQILLGQKIADFSRDATASFSMNAPDCSLTLIPEEYDATTLQNNEMRWQNGVNILAGRLIIDGSTLTNSDNTPGLHFQAQTTTSNTFGGTSSVAGLDLINVGNVELGNTNIAKNGYVTVTNKPVKKSPVTNLTMTDNAYYRHSAEDDSLYGVLINEWTLSGTSSAELKAPKFLCESSVKNNITASESATLIIKTDHLHNIQLQPGAYHSLTLGKGNAEIIIARHTKPADLYNSPAIQFNFDTKNGQNNGKFILDFATDDSGTTGGTIFGKNMLLDMGTITIDGVPQTTDSKLNFEWGDGSGYYHYMVVSLKN